MASALAQRFHRWLSDNPDEQILRFVFRSIVTATITVLAIDFASMNGLLTNADSTLTPAEQTSPGGTLPAILAPWLPGGDRRLRPMPQPVAQWASR